MKGLKWPLLLVSAISSLGMMGAAYASNGLPAVAHVNGWVGAAANYMYQKHDHGFGGIGEAGVDFPLTYNFAAQFHGYDGAVGGRNIQSIDGILFWRNPAQALFGLHGMYTKSGTFRHALYGLHGEYYLNCWTLTGEAGGVSRNDENDTWYAEAIINWYPMPDWRIYLGGIMIDNKGKGELGTEYQLGWNTLPGGLSLFADVGAGSHDLKYAFLGLRYYFGDVCNPCKTLIQRHREDMVPPTLDLLAIDEHEHR